ncbi:MAG: hypothetical protein HGA96_12925 [Desulfobulbaceae bacterium]|nr:hypothetical protein [Desulfobulbaceae bacterium]
MRAILLSLWLTLFLLCTTVVVGANTLSDLQNENFLLSTELQLAKAGKMYIILDLPAGAVLFKAGGIEIKRLPIEHCRVDGVGGASLLRKLNAKMADNQPKRKQVVIASEEEIRAAPAPAAGTDGLVALEITDMPEIYQLEFDDGLLLSVKAPPSGDFKTKAARYWQDTVEYVKSWYQGLQRKMHGEVGSPQIVMNLSGADARQLYWSFDEGMPCLIKN